MANNNYLNKIRIGNEDIDIHDIRNLAASGTDGGAALKTGAIPFGNVDSTSTSTVFTATVDGITELTDGTCVLLKNGVVTSATNFTININGLGAYPAFNNMTDATRESTIFNINYTMLFIFDSTRVVGGITGAWCCYRGYDANTNTIGYQLRGNNGTKTVTDRARYYKIYFTSADGQQWVPASSNWVNDATAAKTVNQRPIDPFGPIVYTSATTNYTEGSVLAAATAWQQYALTLGHSFNVSGGALTLTTNKPVYVKCAPQSNGSAIMDATNPIVQSLPTTEDGKIYIFLGFAYSATAIELRMEHPVYYYKGGAIRLWTNTADTTLGTLNTNNTTAQTTSSSESFGGTINLHKVSKTGSYSDLLNKPTIPDDSNLVHKTGDETIFQKKTIAANGEIHLASSWSQIYNDDDDESLQEALDARNNVQSDWNQTVTTADDYIKNKPTIPAAQIQADWDQTTTTAADYIKNKPNIYYDQDNGLNIVGEHVLIRANKDSGMGVMSLNATESISLNSSFLNLNASGNYIDFNTGGDDDQLLIHGGEGVFIEGANNKNIKLTTSGNGKAYYNNNEIATKNDIPTVPTNVSAFTNDAGYLTSETDPTVPAWAKASTKPTYTAAEVGALPDTTVIPDAPGTLNTNNSTAQTVSSSESLSGTIKLHKISKTGSYNDLLNKPTIPTVNNSTITIQKNSSTVDSFTLNQSSNKTINITVPTTASDVSALPASTKYGASLSVSIDSTTYVVTAQLKDQDGNNLGTAQTIDLPLESVVVSGSYDSATKKVILTLKDGSTIDFSIADLVSGLQTEITSTNKLSADLISDGTTNKVYTATEKTKLAGIASGAEVNVQSDWNVTNTSSDAYIQNKPSIPSKTSDLTNDSNFISTSSTNGLIKNDGTIDTNEYLTDSDVFITPDANEHDYVDLNLPSGTLWATMNVGASTTSDYGNYYMWGKTTPYDETDTQYNGSERNLDASHDVAYQQWGGDWHMPTEEQIIELIQYTRYERISGNDYSKYISQEDSTKYITFPFSGYYSNGQPASTNATASGISGNAFFWSSTNLSEDTTNTNAKFLSIGSSNIGYMPRSYGLTIRPVLDKKKVKNQINFNIRPNWSQTISSAPDYILNKPTIYNSPSINTTIAAPIFYSSLTGWYYDSTGTKYQSLNGTTSTVGHATMMLGNATASGVSGNKQGKLVLYSTGTYSNTLNSINLTANRTLSLPNEDGTLATQAYVTSTIPDITGKADKVSSAVEGNFASLDSSGNLEDSGYSYTDCLNELSDQYAPATESSELEPGDTFEEAFGKLEKTITDNEYITAQALNDLNTNKQDTLESGTNIKTINGDSIIGEGDLSVTGDCIAYPSFEIDSNGHLIMSGGQQGLFTLENGHLMYNF